MESETIQSLGKFGSINTEYFFIIIGVLIISLIDTFKFKRTIYINKLTIFIISIGHLTIGMTGVLNERISALAGAAQFMEDGKFIDELFKMTGYNARYGFILFVISVSLLFLAKYLNSRFVEKEDDSSVCSTNRIVLFLIDSHYYILWWVSALSMAVLLGGFFDIASLSGLSIVVFPLLLNFIFFLWKKRTLSYWIFGKEVVSIEDESLGLKRVFWFPLSGILGFLNIIPAFFNSNGRFVNDYILKTRVVSNSNIIKKRLLIVSSLLTLFLIVVLPFLIYPQFRYMSESLKHSDNSPKTERFIKTIEKNLFTF